MGALAAWKRCTVLFVLQMLSNVSVEEVFMHHFEKMLSASGGFPPIPHRGSTPGPRWSFKPLIIHPGKNPAPIFTRRFVFRFWGLCPPDFTGTLPLDPAGELPSFGPLIIHPWKNPAGAHFHTHICFPLLVSLPPRAPPEICL